jgi:ribosome biogenesis GTPase
MTRDATPPAGNGESPVQQITPLKSLGWQNFFAQQISVDDMHATPPVRVTEVHRSGLRVLGDGIDMVVPPRADATVGDWLLLNYESAKRKPAAGTQEPDQAPRRGP